jgi:hypothetical protein
LACLSPFEGGTKGGCCTYSFLSLDRRSAKCTYIVPPFCKGRLGGFLQIVRKLDIARLVANEPNTLLLDEPTNYISLDDLEAFEAALALFPGPVLAVSHDRRFIRQFRGAIWELSGGVLSLTKPLDILEHLYYYGLAQSFPFPASGESLSRMNEVNREVRDRGRSAL